MRILKIIILCFLGSIINAQNVKIMPLPTVFRAPLSADTDNDDIRRAFAIKGGSADNKSDPWVVMGDRPEVNLLARVNGQSNNQKLKFKETAYVIDETKEWVKIGMGNKDGMKLVSVERSGWIKKTDLLLWPHAYRDMNSRITKKGFLLNKVVDAEAILRGNNSKIVKIYDGAHSTNEVDNKEIYNVYFIFKEEENRVLLGGADYISYGNSNNIIGWADKIRVEKWNQRLTLEPNWESSSFNSRKAKEEQRIYGFKSQSFADSYSKTGNLNKGDILWDNDPAKPGYSDKMKSPDNSNRSIGEVFRFPVFSYNSGFIKSGTINFIPRSKSGDNIVGDFIPPEEMAEIKARFSDDVEPKRNNVNIAFLIEGTEVMKSYKASILASIKNIATVLGEDINIRYAAAIYRDANLAKNNWDFSIQPMTKVCDKVIDFINNTTFDNYTDQDKYTNQRYAIMQLLEKAGFVANQDNIVIVIGAHADFYFDPVRREAAKLEKNKELIDDSGLDKIYKQLTNYNLSMAYFQVKNSAGKAYSKFSEDARGLMITVAQNQYAAFKAVAKNNAEIKNIGYPEMPDLNEGKSSRLKGGIGYGIIKRPDADSNIGQKELIDFINESIKTRYEITNNYYNYIKALVDGQRKKPEDIDDSFSPLVYDFIKKLSVETQEKIFTEKVKFYTYIYLPSQVKGVTNPYKYVIFMPQLELEEYIANLRGLSKTLAGPVDRQREALKVAIIDLILKISGDGLTLKEINDMGINDVAKLMIGIQKEGLVGIQMDRKGIQVKDIMDKNKLKEDELKKWIEILNDKVAKLVTIQRMGDKYPFSYTVGTATYFWIALELLDWTE